MWQLFSGRFALAWHPRGVDLARLTGYFTCDNLGEALHDNTAKRLRCAGTSEINTRDGNGRAFQTPARSSAHGGVYEKVACSCVVCTFGSHQRDVA
jgi:hypothetical protein